MTQTQYATLDSFIEPTKAVLEFNYYENLGEMYVSVNVDSQYGWLTMATDFKPNKYTFAILRVYPKGQNPEAIKRIQKAIES